MHNQNREATMDKDVDIYVKPNPDPNLLETIYDVRIRSHYGFGALPSFFRLIMAETFGPRPF